MKRKCLDLHFNIYLIAKNYVSFSQVLVIALTTTSAIIQPRLNKEGGMKWALPAENPLLEECWHEGSSVVWPPWREATMAW